jgi:hypothetical protein
MLEGLPWVGHSVTDSFPWVGHSVTDSFPWVGHSVTDNAGGPAIPVSATPDYTCRRRRHRPTGGRQPPLDTKRYACTLPHIARTAAAAW